MAWAVSAPSAARRRNATGRSLRGGPRWQRTVLGRRRRRRRRIAYGGLRALRGERPKSRGMITSRASPPAGPLGVVAGANRRAPARDRLNRSIGPAPEAEQRTPPTAGPAASVAPRRRPETQAAARVGPGRLARRRAAARAGPRGRVRQRQRAPSPRRPRPASRRAGYTENERAPKVYAWPCWRAPRCRETRSRRAERTALAPRATRGAAAALGRRRCGHDARCELLCPCSGAVASGREASAMSGGNRGHRRVIGGVAMDRGRLRVPGRVSGGSSAASQRLLALRLGARAQRS